MSPIPQWGPYYGPKETFNHPDIFNTEVFLINEGLVRMNVSKLCILVTNIESFRPYLEPSPQFKSLTVDGRVKPMYLHHQNLAKKPMHHANRPVRND